MISQCQDWGANVRIEEKLYFTSGYRGFPPYTLSQHPDNKETGYSNVLPQADTSTTKTTSSRQSEERDLRSAYCLRQILYRVAIVVANQMCHQHRPADFFSPDKKVSANFTFLSFQQLCKMELISRYAKWLAHSRRPKIEPSVHVHFEICIWSVMQRLAGQSACKVVLEEVIITSNI